MQKSNLHTITLYAFKATLKKIFFTRACCRRFFAYQTIAKYKF